MYKVIMNNALKNVPFAKLLGIEPVSLHEDRSVVEMKSKPDVLNHINTFHAGAIFTLGESASGLSMAGALAPVVLGIRPVAVASNIEYLAPGTELLRAEGQVDGDIKEILKTLQADGKVKFRVSVVIKNTAAKIVAKMYVDWHVKLN